MTMRVTKSIGTTITVEGTIEIGGPIPTRKHDWDGAKKVLAEWGAVDTAGWERERRKMLEDSMRYFANHLHQMDYKRCQDMGWPIGSGVTEAACMTLVKQRLCRSGTLRNQ